MSRGDWWSVVVTLFIGGLAYFIGGPRAAFGAMAIAVIIGLILHFTRPKGVRGQEDSPQLGVPLQRRMRLGIRFDGDFEPYKFVEPGGPINFRFEVYNGNSEVVSNVHARLCGILPRLNDPAFPADYPYAVRLAHNGNVDGTELNPGDKIQFEILRYWVNAARDALTVEHVDTKRSASASWIRIPIHREDECWVMQYEVTAANAERQEISFKVKRQGEQLFVSRV